MSFLPSLKNTVFTRLLALALLLASVSVASHVHAETEADAHGEQLESCELYHQFHSLDEELPKLVAVYSVNQVHAQAVQTQELIDSSRALPPARAPPAVPS